jgi:hypothetical protein
MTSVLGVSVPKVGIAKQEEAPKEAPKTGGLLTGRNIALGGLAATFLIGGGVIGAMRGNPLVGLGVGGALAAATVGAALIGNASSSQRDGYCDYYGDPDCDYPGVGYDPYPHDSHYPGRYDNPHWDGGYRDDDFDGGREDYPDTGYYPGGGTSHGDDW